MPALRVMCGVLLLVMVTDSQVTERLQELDLEPQNDLILTRGFGDRNFLFLFLDHGIGELDGFVNQNAPLSERKR